MRASRSPATSEPVGGGPKRRRRRSRGVAVIAGLAIIAGASACGDITEQSMCPAYDDFLAARAAVQGVDAESLTAADVAELAQDYLDSVRRLQETADDRYDAMFETLEAAARDVVLTLESVQDQADYSTWAPLVEDDLEAVANAAVTVEDAIEPQCPNPGGDS